MSQPGRPARSHDRRAEEEAPPWPRDEWIIGDAAGSAREYVYHAAPPRFLARVVICGEDGMPEPSERPVDVLSGVAYPSEDFLLCEVVWFDDVAPGEVVKWLEAAADAVETSAP